MVRLGLFGWCYVDLCCIPRLIVTYCYVILVRIGAMSGTRWGKYDIWPMDMEVFKGKNMQTPTGREDNQYRCHCAVCATSSNWIHLVVFFHPIRSLRRRSGGASGRLPQRPKGGLWRTGWWGCGSQRLIDTWFGRKIWLDLHVHESMLVFKFQHGHPKRGPCSTLEPMYPYQCTLEM